ncbi:hypothetical protein BDA99DRAFT_540197 [Phascolomyces articulosus]|uniref:PH domain-containing protein n=1 Tax=Phascolomyces articulosus TaxID=60185 RepID=A0AAD5PAY1_9FUNG|nr:hypothetical protein BDA99DRAFT_540197 [Phascolomyces articulosus]
MPLPSDYSDDDLDSRADTFTDQSSIQQPPQKSPQGIRRNQPTTESTRRKFFAEKYGLNTPDGESVHSLSQDGRRLSDPHEVDEEDSEDDQPLQTLSNRHTYQPQPSSSQQPQSPYQHQQRASYQPTSQQQPTITTMRGAVGLARPISVCNIAQATSPARPPRFVKPATQMTTRQVKIPGDMQQVHDLSEHFHRKVYMEGYLLKMNAFNTDGRQHNDQRWVQHYVELCGPVLTLWNAETTEEGETLRQASNPEYINITDSYVNLIDQEGQFMLNSAGANRYIFQTTPSTSNTTNNNNSGSAQTWVLAIRLACFEGARIHEFYTRRFVIASRHADIVTKRVPKVEGWLQVRFPGQTGWKKYWTVVTDRRTEKKLIFSKKSVMTRGQLMFYESKKAKFPVKSMVNVVQAYTIYPESPQLIDLATMMKVEGKIMDWNTTTGAQKVYRDAASTLVMATNAKELTQWLVGTFDFFRLYGRPEKLLDDPMNSNALNFGEPRRNGDLPRLFLEVHEAYQVKVNQGETLLDNKLAFANILEQKMRQYQSASGTPSVPPPNTAGIMGRTNSMPLISGIPTGSSSNNNSTYGSEDGQQYPPAQRRPASSMANTLPSGSTTAQNRYSAPLLQQMNSSAPQQQQSPQQPNPNNRYSAMSPMGAGRSRQSMLHIYASDDSDDDDDEEEEEEDDDTSSTSSTGQKTNTLLQPTTTTSTTTKASPLPHSETLKIEVPTSPTAAAPVTTFNTIPVATPTPSQPQPLQSSLNVAAAAASLAPSSESESDHEPLPQQRQQQQQPKPPVPQHTNQRRPSEMTLPEISESTDFMSSILGDMSLNDHNNNNNNTIINRGPPPPPPAHVTPMASTSTPILDQQKQQHRDISKFNNNNHHHEEKHIATSSTTSDDSSTTSSHSSSKKTATASPVSPPTPQQQQMNNNNKPSRPSSAMAWRRSSSNLLMQPSSSGSSSVRSMTPSGSETSSMGQQQQQSQRQQQRYQQHRGSVQLPHNPSSQQQQQRRSMYMNDHGGRRSSSAILLQQHWETPEEDEHEEDPYQHHSQQPYSMGGGMVSPHHQQQQYPMYHHQQQQYDPYGYQQYQHYAEGHDDDDDDNAPIIPQVGTHFVTQNSLLDMYQSEQLPARVQEEHARMSGQPLVSLPNKPPKPKAGLVGMISQLEHEKKERENVKGRIMEMEKERALEQERERFYMDQQQQQQRHSAMMQQQQTSTPPASFTPQSMMTPTHSQPQQPFTSGGGGLMMMDPRMSMSAGPTQPMMNPQMMMLPMMTPQSMMDPRMSMMPNMAMMYMMQGSYGQMAPSMPMFYNPMMMQAPEKIEDADDDVPLGSHTNHQHHTPSHHQHRQQRQRSNSHHF